MNYRMEASNQGASKKVASGQSNRASLAVTSVAISVLLFVSGTPRAAQSQSQTAIPTTTVPFTISIGTTGTLPVNDTMDNSWNVVTVGGNTYFVGANPNNWAEWTVCQGANIGVVNCPQYTDTNPVFTATGTAGGWPALGGTEQGWWWPDGIYADPSSGTWYAGVHVEYNYNDNHEPADEAHFRGIGLATSIDQGHNWVWQGWIVTSPNASPTASMNQYPGMYYDYGPGDCQMTLGRDGYLYLFYGEGWVRKGDSTRFLAGRVARSHITTNLAPLSTNNVPPGSWYKYYTGNGPGNDWNTEAGVGGRGSDVFFGMGTTNVIFNTSPLSQFIMIGQSAESIRPPFAYAAGATIATAPTLEGEQWTTPMAIANGQSGTPSASPNFLLWYNQSIDLTNPNVNTVGSSFDVYADSTGPASLGDYKSQFTPVSLGAGSTTSTFYNMPYPIEPVNDANPGYAGVNVALGVQVWASTNNGNLPGNAVDGDLGTAWIASSGSMSLSNPQTLTVNLGASMPLGSVKQTWNETDNSTFSYRILGSNDNVKWTVLADRSAGVTTTSSMEPVSPLVVNQTDAVTNSNHDVTLDNVFGSYQYVQLEVDGITNGHWASSADFAVYLADNLALGSYAVANSTASTSSANNAIDNLLSTAWVASGTPSPGAPQTLTINLGPTGGHNQPLPMPIGTIIQRFNDTDNSTYYFKILGSNDGSTWSPIVDYTTTGVVGPLSVISASPGGNLGSWQYLQLSVTGISNGHSASSQEFQVYYPSAGPIVSGKTYRLTNLKSGDYLTLPSKFTTDLPVVLDVGECTGGNLCPNQQWLASYMGSGQWNFTNTQSGNSLEVNGTNGTIDTWGYSGGTNQLWTLQSSGIGTYKIVNAATLEVLNDQYGTEYNNASHPVIQWTNNWDTGSMWTFVPMN